MRCSLDSALLHCHVSTATLSCQIKPNSLFPTGNFPVVMLVHYLMPVLTGIVDLLYRTWLENIYESKGKKRNKNECPFLRWLWKQNDTNKCTWLVQQLTRTAELHPSGSPWSCPRSFCQSHPLSTASAPLPSEGHTCLQADRGVGEASSHMTNTYFSVSTTTLTTIVWNLIIDQL